MAKAFVGGAFLLGLIVLGAAFFLPSMMDVTQENAVETIELEQSQVVDLTDTLELQLDRVNATSDDANVTYTNTRTLETNETLLHPAQPESVNLSGDTINTTLDDVIDNDTAQITAVYPPLFGWSGGPRSFMANLDLVLALFGFALVGVGLIGAIPD